MSQKALTKQERIWLFNGRCPLCGSTNLVDRPRDGVAVLVDGKLITDIKCPDCRFAAVMTVDYRSQPKPEALRAS